MIFSGPQIVNGVAKIMGNDFRSRSRLPSAQHIIYRISPKFMFFNKVSDASVFHTDHRFDLLGVRHNFHHSYI